MAATFDSPALATTRREVFQQGFSAASRYPTASQQRQSQTTANQGIFIDSPMPLRYPDMQIEQQLSREPKRDGKAGRIVIAATRENTSELVR
jgi:hypothetical protein